MNEYNKDFMNHTETSFQVKKLLLYVSAFFRAWLSVFVSFDFCGFSSSTKLVTAYKERFEVRQNTILFSTLL